MEQPVSPDLVLISDAVDLWAVHVQFRVEWTRNWTLHMTLNWRLLITIVTWVTLNSEGGSNANIVTRVRIAWGTFRQLLPWLTLRAYHWQLVGASTKPIFDQSSYMRVNVRPQLLVSFLNYNVMTALCIAEYARHPWKTVKVHFPSWTDLV